MFQYTDPASIIVGAARNADGVFVVDTGVMTPTSVNGEQAMFDIDTSPLSAGQEIEVFGIRVWVTQTGTLKLYEKGVVGTGASGATASKLNQSSNAATGGYALGGDGAGLSGGSRGVIETVVVPAVGSVPIDFLAARGTVLQKDQTDSLLVTFAPDSDASVAVSALVREVL